jgi:MFS family permease
MSQIDSPTLSELEFADQRAGAATQQPGRVRFWQGWLLFLLTFSVVLAFADRSLLSILVDPIKADLQLSDVRISLLIGLSFSVIYSLAALPLGALVDVVDRRKLIAIAVVIWSAMTIYCGFAQSFTQLFIGRMGLGIAEAAIGPAAFSLIRDSFSPTQRGRAFAVFNASHLLGTGTALLVGGSLLGFASTGGFAGVPIIGALHPWQQVLAALGLFGIPVGFLILTMREPARTSTQTRAGAPGFGEALRYTWQHKAVLFPFWAGLALFAMAQGGVSAWTPMVVHRSWSVSIPTVGHVLGPVQMAVGLTASYAMGSLMDHLARRGMKDAPIRVCAASLALSGIAVASQFLITDLRWAAVAYVLQIFFFAAYAVAGSAGLALIAPPRLAGKLQALTGLATSLIGLASGPTVVALVSSIFFTGPRALHDGLASVLVATIAAGVLLFMTVSRALHRQTSQVF